MLPRRWQQKSQRQGQQPPPAITDASQNCKVRGDAARHEGQGRGADGNGRSQDFPRYRSHADFIAAVADAVWSLPAILARLAHHLEQSMSPSGPSIDRHAAHIVANVAARRWHFGA